MMDPIPLIYPLLLSLAMWAVVIGYILWLWQ